MATRRGSPETHPGWQRRRWDTGFRPGPGPARLLAAASRTRLEASLRGLQRNRQRLQDQVAADPAGASDLRRQLLDVQSQISDVQGHLAALGAVPHDPTLKVQQPARAIQINARGFDYRVDHNENADSSLKPQTQHQDGPGFDETDL